jgi:ATP-dependent RNA helicase DDX24/MAK5
MQGSGKTLAFGLPIINLLVSEAASTSLTEVNMESRDDNVTGGRRRNVLKALVLCPTRELANQVHAHISAVGKPLGVTCASITGGMSRQKQERVLRGGPAVVVATPGRLWDLISSGVPHVGDLSGLACLVIDEADRMVAQGHFQELQGILSQVPAYTQRLSSAAGSADKAAKRVAATQGDAGTAATADVAFEDQQTSPRVATRTLRTYVFSATLTLPSAMKAKLQRSRTASRGSEGGASFEALVDMIPFRGKPKVSTCQSQHTFACAVARTGMCLLSSVPCCHVAYDAGGKQACHAGGCCAGG